MAFVCLIFGRESTKRIGQLLKSGEDQPVGAIKGIRMLKSPNMNSEHGQ